MTEEPGKKGWMDDVQAALDRANEALSAAWEATRDTRVRALEAAKQAVEELGVALDRGVAVAKDRWAAMADRDEEDEVPAEPSEEE
ncbi:MAG: hypothetical protein EHM57_01505 [Actinobacteria bacterium]|nr:MAG: hypothetical protein EHM57_01505 [Actinomycetota bacterium]